LGFIVERYNKIRNFQVRKRRKEEEALMMVVLVAIRLPSGSLYYYWKCK